MLLCIKPRLLLSNHCHVEYFNLALPLSLNSWLTKLRVLFVIHEGNLCSGQTSVGWAHTVSRVSQEPQKGYGYDHNKYHWHSQSSSESTFLKLHSWWSGSCKTRSSGISYSPSISAVLVTTIFVVTLSLCLCRRLWSTKALLFPKAWADYTRRDLSISVHTLVPKTWLCTRPHPQTQ